MTELSGKKAELLKELAQVEAQIEAHQNRHKDQERKRDTRRKILIGGTILGMVRDGEYPREKLMSLLDRKLTQERDRKLFDLPSRGSRSSDEASS